MQPATREPTGRQRGKSEIPDFDVTLATLPPCRSLVAGCTNMTACDLERARRGVVPLHAGRRGGVPLRTRYIGLQGRGKSSRSRRSGRASECESQVRARTGERLRATTRRSSPAITSTSATGTRSRSTRSLPDADRARHDRGLLRPRQTAPLRGCHLPRWISRRSFSVSRSVARCCWINRSRRR